jgi:exodeoxyribonuclease V beta subunit
VTGRHAFAIDGFLPVGLTALEASAGTGKTFALSSLAARFVAECGVPASGLCIVSFTEAATAELRSRVRSRLVEVHAHLERCLAAGRSISSDDPLLEVVARTDPAGLDIRRRHASEALAEFDAATITTIHGFCRRVLAGSGGASGDLDITDGAADVAEAVADLLIARFGDDPACPITARRLEQAVRLRLSMPDAQMWRLPPDVKKPTDGQRPHHLYCDVTADLVDEVCETVRERRSARRRRTFDGLLADTRSLLSGPEGATVVAGLRQRTRVVLIDEFQDTDTVQWDVFRRAFVTGDPVAGDPAAGSSRPVVVLVGDPKQSIYRFRSAELAAYLAAVAAADEVATLPVNWRSDAPLLGALEALFGGFHFGDPAVVFQPVSAADHHAERAITGAGSESLTLRWVDPGPEGEMAAPDAHTQIQRDVVATVGELLAEAAAGVATVPDGDGGRRRLRPSDIAILTRSNSQASLLTRMLGEAGIAAASASNESVLESEAARQWRHLLAALEQPGSAGRIRAAALGWSLGMTGSELAGLDDRGLDELHEQFRTWSQALTTAGLPRLIALVRTSGLHEHVLSCVGGERHLTDFDHIAELLLTITAGRPCTATTLLGHLTALDLGVFDPSGNAGGKQDAMASDVLARRIDRDDEAVQVLTTHKAKGLEFGVVLCPFLWPSSTSSGPPHAQLDGVRQIQTPWITGAKDGKWLDQLKSASSDETKGEDRRLLYVALTRARHRCYVWWPALTTGKKGGVLGELLGHALGTGEPPASSAELSGVVEHSGGTFAVRHVPRRGFTPPVPAATTPDHLLPALEAAVAARRPDRAWRIWSFSAISSAVASEPHVPHGAGQPLEHADAAPMVGGVDEPPADPVTAGVDADAPASLSGVLRSVVGGTAFGTMVHEVLEQVDFASDELAQQLRAEIDRRLGSRAMRVDPAVLVDGLVAAIESPLGGPLGGLRLRDVPPRDRLDELQFDLPLGRLRADHVGRVLAEHLPADDPLRPWAERVASDGFEIDLAGMLTGSIDLVVRTAGAPLAARYVVADYKTNQLGPESAYARADLVTAMEHHHYPLQAALYLVALHRYLRWRLPGYRAEQHLGGAAYLFVRGMDPARPADDARGVHWFTPPPAAVDALDRLLAGGDGA